MHGWPGTSGTVVTGVDPVVWLAGGTVLSGMVATDGTVSVAIVVVIVVVVTSLPPLSDEPLHPATTASPLSPSTIAAIIERVLMLGR